ncbi:phosphoadenosine phosphosulfate reductase [Dysgonomonas sp. 521]|uniref:phosphoadenosine phosphosulfate reductase domain-containing protein n=1 Tax=Dysgonomonas sp. 521 TaxID=2302932 RepID=UPI0013D07F61|nr:phosphoadenosine phosphosulfate reductase family protein [Dysgonomonas sp. 521]NDV93476.1 phosphoadenosine phosphosulfate reductase [Dysgonomonas sp. 521]
MNVLTHTEQVVKAVSQKTDRILLFYSCGKDSIAMLDLIAPHFKEVMCVYMYFVKGLSHIDRFINYSKVKYPNVSFIEVPHWNMSRVLKIGLYCKPDPKIKLLLLKDIVERVRVKTGIEWCFYGMKQADSLNRRLMLRGDDYDLQAINNKTKNVYPLSLWKKKEVLAYLKSRNLPEPIQYSKEAGNGLWFDLKVYLFLKDNYPQDLQKILSAFPLSEKILYDYQQSLRSQNDERGRIK